MNTSVLVVPKIFRSESSHSGSPYQGEPTEGASTVSASYPHTSLTVLLKPSGHALKRKARLSCTQISDVSAKSCIPPLNPPLVRGGSISSPPYQGGVRGGQATVNASFQDLCIYRSLREPLLNNDVNSMTVIRPPVTISLI